MIHLWYRVRKGAALQKCTTFTGVPSTVSYSSSQLVGESLSSDNCIAHKRGVPAEQLVKSSLLFLTDLVDAASFRRSSGYEASVIVHS